ncbi:Kynurenine formamidase [Spathaspora sp. JA1]|nr:Kynurenine formamidase [Spathaspora sp. JA1]
MSDNTCEFISYGDHPLQKVKVFHYSASNEKNLVYIHGGGWRDPNNTYDDFQEVIQRQLDMGLRKNCNFFSINYRLSPEVKHPFHLIDVMDALHQMEIFCGGKIRNVSIVGHSVGATLALQLLDYCQIYRTGFQNLGLPSPNNVVKCDIQFDNIVFLDGIYDVVELLKEYPSYSAFVNEAFPSEQSIRGATMLSMCEPQPIPSFIQESTQFIIIQSVQDELLSRKQTQLLVDYFISIGREVTVRFGNLGQHEQVYRSGLAEELNRFLDLS